MRPFTRTTSVLSIAALAASALVTAAPIALAAELLPSEWVIGPHKKIAYITLDGQTKVKHLRSVLETLENRRANASFFFPGKWVERHRRDARRVLNAGHKLGNRGYGTAPFTQLDETTLRGSIQRAAEVLGSVGAHSRPFLRPPNGARDLRVLQIAGSMGYRSVRWTHNPGGGQATRVKRAVMRNLKWGSIISLDIARVSHRAALGEIIEALREKGFALATIKRLENVHPIRWDVTLKSGSNSAEVSYLQQTLKDTSYPAGAVDGSFGYSTLQAVYAFEKTWGLTRDGVVTPPQLTRMAMSKRPPTPKRKYHNFIDVDISRQVLFEVRDDKVVHTIPISSGNEETYTVDGEERRAHTPRGDFSVVRKIKGKRVSHLGTLWWPSYFVGGYAIHGSDSVPTYPASHGCVRIPRYLEKAFFYRNPVGRPVFVHD